MIGAIPVRNIWLLMLYASRLYRELPSRRRYGVEENPDELPNLVAEILTGAVQRRIRRNLTFEFQRSRADLTRVRGRIDALRTERRGLLRQGQDRLLLRRTDHGHATESSREGSPQQATRHCERRAPSQAMSDPRRGSRPSRSG